MIHGYIELLPTGSKTLTKVDSPFGCVGCISTQPRSVRMEMLKSKTCLERVSRSLHVKNPCDNHGSLNIGFWLQLCSWDLKNIPIHILNNCEIPIYTYISLRNHNPFIYLSAQIVPICIYNLIIHQKHFSIIQYTLIYMKH